MADAVAIILADGPATRLKTALPKALHRAGGRALLEYALDAATGSGVRAVAVLGPAEAEALAALTAERATYVPGGESLAAGIQRALAQLPPAPTVLLLPCDHPQLTAAHLQALLTFHQGAGSGASTLSIGGAPVGAYAVAREALLALSPEATPEALLPAARVYSLAGQPLIDVDTRADLARAERLLRRATLERLMDEGVTILDPESTFIDAGVRVGMDTVIYPWTLLEGRTEIGQRCTIGPHAHLIHCVTGDEVTIEAAVIRESRLGHRVAVGPYAQLRPGCDVGEGTKLGDFVELKNAQVGAHVSIAHLAYVGDAEVGDHANIGAGVITCNFDGFEKHRTTIGAHAFVGSNSVLIAPVTIGPGAYVAAHSAIPQEVPADALGIARSRQENKPDWARRRRESRGKG
ncbi:MAG: NTP transferase domain-containing protein [Armatimonadetes bacterium]|nr:NTP transferase domain-containing protein [Armatimonadota bacterium]